MSSYAPQGMVHGRASQVFCVHVGISVGTQAASTLSLPRPSICRCAKPLAPPTPCLCSRSVGEREVHAVSNSELRDIHNPFIFFACPTQNLQTDAVFGCCFRDPTKQKVSEQMSIWLMNFHELLHFPIQHTPIQNTKFHSAVQSHAGERPKQQLWSRRK